MSNRFPRKPGRRAIASRIALLSALLVLGCNYGFQGGGGFPSHVRTLYVEPFENETPQFELQDQIFNELMDELPRALGVRPGTRESADVIVRGRIVRYDDVARNYTARAGARAPDILEQEVQIGVSIQIIDTKENVILWEQSGLTGRGGYSPASETDTEGRAKAVQELIQQIIDGAQSQW